MKDTVKKIYFDMDGVLADFEGGAREFCGLPKLDPGQRRTEEEDDLMWQKIREVEHFYDRIKPLVDGVEVFRKLYAIYGDKCEILTGIPKPRRGILTAGEDKINWSHRILSEDIVVNIVYREQKKDFCKGSDYILIDDLPSNIDSWKNFGGTGILHKDAQTTLNILTEKGII